MYTDEILDADHIFIVSHLVWLWMTKFKVLGHFLLDWLLFADSLHLLFTFMIIAMSLSLSFSFSFVVMVGMVMIGLCKHTLDLNSTLNNAQNTKFADFNLLAINVLIASDLGELPCLCLALLLVLNMAQLSLLYGQPGLAEMMSMVAMVSRVIEMSRNT